MGEIEGQVHLLRKLPEQVLQQLGRVRWLLVQGMASFPKPWSWRARLALAWLRRVELARSQEPELSRRSELR